MASGNVVRQEVIPISEQPQHRIFNDSAEGLAVSDPGPEQSEAALAVLREQGADAYRRYIAEHSAD